MTKPTYEELEAQVKQLAAENAALKSGKLFFMYSDETGFEIHKNQESAIASAKDMIAVCREEAAQDGWPEDADTICWGVIMQKAVETNFEKPSEQNGWIGWSEYKLNPELETTATDAAIASLRAEGVEMFAQYLKDKYEGIEYSLIGEYYTNGEEDRISDQGEIDCARDFAAQLRSQSEVQS